MVKIKICGITGIEDAGLASDFGAWAVGFIFVKNTPRYINPEKAAEIISSLPENIEKVGVFANSNPDEIVNAAKISGITMIQLHGDESTGFCDNLAKKLSIPIIKAIKIKNLSDLEIIPEYKDKISAILLDTYSETEPGGTGKAFNWEIAEAAKVYDIPLILAGGLNPDNIKDAYNRVNPYAFDVSSGIEKEKGVKDHNKMKELFQTFFIS